MTLRATLVAIVLGGTGCGSSIPPAVVDAGADAGVVDAGTCEPLPAVADGNALSAPYDTLVGQPVTFQAFVVEPMCVIASATGPGGVTAPVRIGAEGSDFTFTPTSIGVWSLRVTGVAGVQLADWVQSTTVVAPRAPAVPCLVLHRPCFEFSFVNGLYGCDEVLFDGQGAALATLDGGLWFGEAGALFAWVDGQLHPASVAGAQVTLGAGLETPFPDFWAVGAGKVVLGESTDGGVLVYRLDGGAPSEQEPFLPVDEARAARVQPDGTVTVIGTQICGANTCRDLGRGAVERLFALNARQLAYELPGGFDGAHVVVESDVGPAFSGSGTTPWLDGPNRRVLSHSTIGWVVLDFSLNPVGAPMLEVSGATSDRVWSTRFDGTDIYCQ